MRNVEAQGAKSRKKAFLRYEQRQRKVPKKADGRAGEVRRLGAGVEGVGRVLVREQGRAHHKSGSSKPGKRQLPLGP